MKDEKMRFDELVSLNLEGMSSKKEDQALWLMLDQRPDARKEFIETRKIHFLLKIILDESATAKRFTNRILNALHPDRMSDKAFVAAVQNRLNSTPNKKSTRRYHLTDWRIAASIILVLTCTVIFKNIFFNPEIELSDMAQVEDHDLDWHHPPSIRQLKNKMYVLYGAQQSRGYGYPDSKNHITQHVKQLSAQMDRVEKNMAYTERQQL